MTTSQLTDAIRKWTAANGRGPTFEELHSLFGGSDDTLRDELDKARQANMIGENADGTYFEI